MGQETMNGVENPMVKGLGRHYARQDRRDGLAQQAYTSLRNELIDALMNDPAKTVRTPGFGKAEMPAYDVITDAFSGRDGDQALHELLRIVSLCAKGQADHELHLRASAWVAARADEHAAFHDLDLLAELDESDE